MIGQTLKHYSVEEILGKGGMGVVYRARDTRLGRLVALKILNAEFTGDPDRRRRFLQEARSASAVTHPAIAQIYDVDEVDGVTFIAMELVEGQTVRKLVANRELDLLGALEISIQVGDGLGKAHHAGIIHRDIKSDNIIVTPDGHAKILDFGLAKPLVSASTTSSGKDSQEHLSQVDTMVKTQVGTVVGTIAYMSPEQARGRTLDARSDLFSLGVVIYEMVTGQLPFGGDSLLDTMHAIAFEETRPVTTLKENLPPELQRIVSRCLKKQPEDRYANAGALVTDLKALKRDTESGITRTPPLKERVLAGYATLKEIRPSSYAKGMGVALAFVLLLYLISGEKGPSIPLLIFLGCVGAWLYRRMRNRRQSLLKTFVAKAAKMPEVHMIVFRENCATVIVDKTQAKIYVRLNALMESINSKLYVGEPLTVAVRDNLPADEFRRLLEGPGVLYVHENVFDNQPQSVTQAASR